MSKKELARRAVAEVSFAGIDISEAISKYLISLTYTDNEEDEADDLQIQLEDRDDIWLEKWLNDAVQAAASRSNSELNSDTSISSPSTSQYKVTAKSGLNVRSGPGTSHGKLGLLAYGTTIDVFSITDGWALIKYSGKDAHVSANYIQALAGGSSSSGGSWAIGDAVIANGSPQYSSYGNGKPGKSVTDYHGSITNLNLKSGIPYPIHVGSLGWFAEPQVRKEGVAIEEKSEADDTVKGLKIQAVIVRENWEGDGKDNMLDCGEFELDSVNASGPPSEITIKCTSLPYKARIRQTKKSKSWEGYTLSGIAKEMAARNGMACLYESSFDPGYERVEQITESDISFLSKLCHNNGISLKATNNILVLFDQSEYEAQGAVMTITRGKGYLKYKLSNGAADTKYASCRVSYTDPNTGAAISATAYVEDYKEDDEDNQQLEVTAKVNSVGEAQALAEKSLRLKNKYEYSASFTIPGDPRLVAGVTVMIDRWGPWSGKYIIKQAKHSFGSSGYTTQISLRRVLEGY